MGVFEVIEERVDLITQLNDVKHRALCAIYDCLQAGNVKMARKIACMGMHGEDVDYDSLTKSIRANMGIKKVSNNNETAILELPIQS